MSENVDLWNRLRSALEDCGKSARQASLEAGLSQDYISKTLKRRTVPEFQKLMKLAEVIPLDLSGILPSAEDETEKESVPEKPSVDSMARDLNALVVAAVAWNKRFTDDNVLEYSDQPRGFYRLAAERLIETIWNADQVSDRSKMREFLWALTSATQSANEPNQQTTEPDHSAQSD